jgi:hypothetical protein
MKAALLAWIAAASTMMLPVPVLLTRELPWQTVAW